MVLTEVIYLSNSKSHIVEGRILFLF